MARYEAVDFNHLKLLRYTAPAGLISRGLTWAHGVTHSQGVPTRKCNSRIFCYYYARKFKVVLSGRESTFLPMMFIGFDESRRIVNNRYPREIKPFLSLLFSMGSRNISGSIQLFLLKFFFFLNLGY